MDYPFPNLQIVPIYCLLVNEGDSQRIVSIMECLAAEGILRNPPTLVTTGMDGLHYGVLDGTDWVIALRKMKAPHILGQIIEPGDVRTPRALRVNYPLAELIDEKPLVEKNTALQQWLQARILEKAVRCYEEATVLFDE